MNALIGPDALLAVLRDVTVLDVRWRLGQSDGADLPAPRRAQPERVRVVEHVPMPRPGAP